MSTEYNSLLMRNLPLMLLRDLSELGIYLEIPPSLHSIVDTTLHCIFGGILFTITISKSKIFYSKSVLRFVTRKKTLFGANLVYSPFKVTREQQ